MKLIQKFSGLTVAYSKVVLNYIKNKSQRFHIFVANRVHISEITNVNSWKYVEAKKNNPVDDASRGINYFNKQIY